MLHLSSLSLDLYDSSNLGIYKFLKDGSCYFLTSHSMHYLYKALLKFIFQSLVSPCKIEHKPICRIYCKMFLFLDHYCSHCTQSPVTFTIHFDSWCIQSFFIFPVSYIRRQKYVTHDLHLNSWGKNKLMDLIVKRVGSSDVLLRAVFLLSSMLLPCTCQLKTNTTKAINIYWTK